MSCQEITSAKLVVFMELEANASTRHVAWWLNSLAPSKFEWNFRHVIFKWILVIDGWGISYEIALIWMSLDFTDDQSTLVQVMAWWRQAASQYLSQCWPRSLSPYGVTRPEWVKVHVLLTHSQLSSYCNSSEDQAPVDFIYLLSLVAPSHYLNQC